MGAIMAYIPVMLSVLQHGCRHKVVEPRARNRSLYSTVFGAKEGNAFMSELGSKSGMVQDRQELGLEYPGLRLECMV
ncbi:Hypothetical predicted protein [Pelobates cultripes]|uniref:Uncharacterized protein n=1 Tax=Pelobates cultripes TaxID=61616 RepID=A0AAD1RDL2_PELCU|nr:Hypothetical predicted protein [Pelobates cultripes]